MAWQNAGLEFRKACFCFQGLLTGIKTTTVSRYHMHMYIKLLKQIVTFNLTSPEYLFFLPN